MRSPAGLVLALALGGCGTATITELGTLGGSISIATDLNDAAVVVGYGEDAAFQTRPFLWRGGSMTPIATTGTPGSIQMAWGINRAEQVVGRMGAPGAAAHAFLWQAGTTTDLSPGAESYAWDVNETGDVAGQSAAGTRVRATLWADGTATVLPTIAGDRSVAYAVGKHRQVVGASTVEEGPEAASHAVLWADGAVRDLGTLGGRTSTARGITVGRWPDAGDETTYIVGYAQTRDAAEHAFVWNRGRMRDLGTLPGDVVSQELGISSDRVVVGFSRNREGATRACMWIGGAIVDLNTLIPAGSGWVLQAAHAVNDRRQIVGYGQFRGRTRAFLLTLAR